VGLLCPFRERKKEGKRPLTRRKEKPPLFFEKNERLTPLPEAFPSLFSLVSRSSLPSPPLFRSFCRFQKERGKNGNEQKKDRKKRQNGEEREGRFSSSETRRTVIFSSCAALEGDTS
jgi:hypothetical protein